MNVGDIVKKKSNTYSYNDIDYNEKIEVLDVREKNNSLQIKLKGRYYSQPNWFSAKNFIVVEEAVNPIKAPTLFLVCKMINGLDNQLTIDASAFVKFSSEKEAKDAIAAELEKFPENQYGLFPLAAVARVEKPPVKFHTVWKK